MRRPLGFHPKPAFKLWYGCFRQACRRKTGPFRHDHAYFSFARLEDGSIVISVTGCRRLF